MVRWCSVHSDEDRDVKGGGARWTSSLECFDVSAGLCYHWDRLCGSCGLCVR